MIIVYNPEERLAMFKENIKDFNRMFNNLDPDDFDRFTYIMAEVIAEQVKMGIITEIVTNPVRLRDLEKMAIREVIPKPRLTY